MIQFAQSKGVSETQKVPWGIAGDASIRLDIGKGSQRER